MHDKAIASLTQLVEAYSATSELEGKVRWISREDELASKLRAILEKHFGTYASGSTLQRIVDVQFSRAVDEKIDIVPDGQVAKDVLSTDFIAETARSITDWLVHLPRQYTFFIPMPRLWTGWRGAIQLSDHIGFHEFEIDKSGSSKPVDPDFGGEGFAVGELSHSYDNHAVYLTIKVEGVFSGSSQWGAESVAISKAKRFLILSKLTAEHFDDLPDALPQADTGFAIDNEVGPSVAAPFALPGTVRSCLNTWARWPWHEDDDYEDLSKGKLEENLQNSYKSLLPLLEQQDDFPSILSSAEWAFDAWYDDNETNAFIFLAIAFEALLDSSGGETSIGASLADRLAYSVANTLEERRDINAKFRRFYQARSKLAHGKLPRISRADRELLYWGRKYFTKALRAEVALATRKAAE